MLEKELVVVLDMLVMNTKADDAVFCGTKTIPEFQPRIS